MLPFPLLYVCVQAVPFLPTFLTVIEGGGKDSAKVPPAPSCTRRYPKFSNFLMLPKIPRMREFVNPRFPSYFRGGIAFAGRSIVIRQHRPSVLTGEQFSELIPAQLRHPCLTDDEQYRDHVAR